ILSPQPNLPKRPARRKAGGPFCVAPPWIRPDRPKQTKPATRTKIKSSPQNQIKKTAARLQVGGPLRIRITVECRSNPVQARKRGDPDAADKNQISEDMEGWPGSRSIGRQA
ncbi:hypothetical protein, partial [Mesorhizobium salmacidum]